MRFIDVSRIRSCFDEPVRARDGVRLSVDVYMPPDEGRYPVLVTRTPYDNNRSARGPGGTTLAPAPADRFKKLAALGFIVVAADVRGRGDSDGEFVPFVHEVRDGADTIEWARELPEFDGRLGAFGAGYAGFTALAAAPSVDAVAVWSPFTGEGTPYRSGVLRLDWLFWMHLVGGRTVQPVDVPAWSRVFRHRPVIEMDDALGREDIPWREWLEDESHLQQLADIAVPSAPTLLVTGWWDPALAGTIDLWEAATGAAHALVVGPWDSEAVRHPRANVGGVEWGPSALVDPEELLVEWFDAHLRQVGEPLTGARLFVTGRNDWAVLASPERSDRTWWLASGGRANTRSGDGRLDGALTGDGPPDRFTHNPDDPVPWQPGYGAFSRTAPVELSLDTGFATGRDDVLVYESEAVATSVVIEGRPSARIWVQSDAESADWVVALEDSFPGGARSVHLSHAIARTVRVEHGAAPVELLLRLAPVCHEMLPGHRLRLLLASSLFPLYAVNLGGTNTLYDMEPRLSEHLVFHDVRFPSSVTVPVAPA